MTAAFDYRLFAAEVRRKRLTCGLSYRELSEVVGISFSTLHRIENNPTHIEMDTFARLCDWLRIEPREFFYEDVE